MNPFQVVRDFEAALCEYTGAPYAVTVNSCTMALLLAVAYCLRSSPCGDRIVQWARPRTIPEIEALQREHGERSEIEIPKRTYVSVPMSIIHAGGWPAFRDEDWRGWYDLRPLNVIDSARRFKRGMFNDPAISHLAVRMVCVSFHHSKILGDTQGGAILHADPEADYWLRRARFDGRQEGIPPALQVPMSWIVGWHCYMSPDVAARLLWKLSKLPDDNADLPPDGYPDLSQMEIFR